MKKDLKTKCSLEEEYAFEHRQRIKAEAYISEIWEMNQELTNEVIKLQSVISKGKPLKEEKPPLTDKIRLKMRLKKINEQRQACYDNFGKIIKKSLK
tara:strand:- start:74 stop:364 length:291 start_codon:yes stop_codon:yes gene_type:complete